MSQGALTEHVSQRPDYDTRLLHARGPANLRKAFDNYKDDATLKVVLDTWGPSTTAEFLDYVYFRTEPREHGIRNENLGFSSFLAARGSET